MVVRVRCKDPFTFAAFITGSMMEGCPGHLVQQQSGHSTCWFPPPTRQAAHRSGKSEQKISYVEEPDAWISGPCGQTLIWQIRVCPVCCSCRRITQTTRFRSTVVSATEISCRLTRMKAFEVLLRPGIWKQFRN